MDILIVAAIAFVLYALFCFWKSQECEKKELKRCCADLKKMVKALSDSFATFSANTTTSLTTIIDNQTVTNTALSFIAPTSLTEMVIAAEERLRQSIDDSTTMTGPEKISALASLDQTVDDILAALPALALPDFTPEFFDIVLEGFNTAEIVVETPVFVQADFDVALGTSETAVTNAAAP